MEQVVADIVVSETAEDNTVLHVEKDALLHVKTKTCTVTLERLENILADELITVPPSGAIDLSKGEHYTRSRSMTVQPRTGHKSRRANTGVQYTEIDVPEEDTKPHKQSKPKPSHSGPFDQRMNSGKKQMEATLVTLPPIPIPIPYLLQRRVTTPRCLNLMMPTSQRRLKHTMKMTFPFLCYAKISWVRSKLRTMFW